MKSLSQQMHTMRRHWPNFEFAELGKDHVAWFGELVAIERPYRIMIEYGLPTGLKNDPLFRLFPLVRVLSPRLRPNFKAAEEAPLPHVYFDWDDLPNSALCLFDPAAREWMHSDFVALITIPWASEWLASYEGWRATGKWFAGGRHVSASKKVASS